MTKGLAQEIVDTLSTFLQWEECMQDELGLSDTECLHCETTKLIDKVWEECDD